METWQAILTSAGISALAVFSVYVLTRRDRKSEARLEAKSEMDRWVGKVDATLDHIKSDISKIQEAVQKIFLKLEKVDDSGSPRVLTDLGKKVSREIDAVQWAERLCRSGQLRKEVEGKTDYQLQEFCFDFVHKRLNPDDNERTKLESCAYENGLEVSSVRRVLGIELRDKLMEIVKGNPQ